MGQIGGEIDVAEDVGVGEAEVGVQEDDAFSGGCELDREIDGDIAFADAAFAAGDGDDGRAGCLACDSPQLCCLIDQDGHDVFLVPGVAVHYCGFSMIN